MNTEPVAIATAVTGVATALLALLVGTETITPEVGGYLGGLVAALIVLAGTLVRRKVTPVLPAPEPPVE